VFSVWCRDCDNEFETNEEDFVVCDSCNSQDLKITEVFDNDESSD
jgi:Zn finger protein HypA/HybF involved in hydrogenase expression